MEKPFDVHLIYASVAIVLIFSIGYVSLMPSNEIPKTSLIHLDKTIHIFMYLILSIFMVLGFSNLKDKNLLKKSIPIIISFFCSFLIEILQEFATSSRFFEIFDILANGIGCLIAFLIMKTDFLIKIKYR